MQRVQQVLDRPLELNRRKMREPSGLCGHLPDPGRQSEQVCHNSGSICRRRSRWKGSQVSAKLDDVCHADQESMRPVKAECVDQPTHIMNIPVSATVPRPGRRTLAQRGDIVPVRRYAASPYIFEIFSPPTRRA